MVFAPPCVARIGSGRLPSECNLEDRTLTIGSAKESRPVEIAVRVLNQGAFGGAARGALADDGAGGDRVARLRGHCAHDEVRAGDRAGRCRLGLAYDIGYADGSRGARPAVP